MPYNYFFQVLSDVNEDSLINLIRKYGMQFKEALVFDRIREELRIFCANHTIDEVYNTMFLVRRNFIVESKGYITVYSNVSWYTE